MEKDDMCMLSCTNTSEWNGNIILTLPAIWTFTIVTGNDTVLQQLDYDDNNNVNIWEANKADVACVS